MKKLTARQKRFVDEYLVDLNATQAAIRAGYTHPTTQGPRLLENVGVAAEIAKAQSERSERTNITLDYVLSRLVIEAEREGDGASHSARVTALRELRAHIVDSSSGSGSEVTDALRDIAGKLPG